MCNADSRGGPTPQADGRAIHHTVVIIGGGNAGISIAARLRRAVPGLDVAIVEASTKHYYQPQAGGGLLAREHLPN